MQELMTLIAKDGLSSYLYARNIKKAWPPGENAIIKNSGLAFDYAYNILKDRFPKGEEVIKQNTSYWTVYKRAFL